MALDENSHIVTLFSNITIQDSTLKEPATGNSTNAGVTVASMMPPWGVDDGDHGVIVYLTNAVFQNCAIENINTGNFFWANGFSAQSVQNCYVNNCYVGIYYEVPNPIYYGQTGCFRAITSRT